MKTYNLTIRLDKKLKDLLVKLSKKTGKSMNEISREALMRQLRMDQFETIRKRTMPFAEARGFLTDEDVFNSRRIREYRGKLKWSGKLDKMRAD